MAASFMSTSHVHAHAHAHAHARARAHAVRFSSQVEDRKARMVPGTWLLLPTAWFEYLDTTAMPIYVTAQISKKVGRSDKPACEVKMIGDGVAQITVKYYIDKHPQAYAGMEEIYLMSPSVEILSGEPPTM